MKTILSYMGNFKKRKTAIIAHLSLQALIALTALATPQVLNIMTDAMTKKSVQDLWNAAVLALVATVVYIIITSIDKPLETYIYNKCEQDIQLLIISKIFALKKRNLARFTSGEIITKATQNTQESVRRSLSVVFNLFQGLCVFIFGVVYMASLDRRLVIIAVPYFLALKFVTEFAMKRIKKYSDSFVKLTKRNNSFLIDVLNNLFLIRLFRRQAYFGKSLLAKENENVQVNVKIEALFSIQFFTMLFLSKVAEFAIIYGIGGYWVYKGTLSFGTLVAYTVALDIFEKGLRPLVYGFSDIARVIPNIDNITDFLQLEGCEDEPKTAIADQNFAIKFENVSFGYGDVKVLDNVSFEIKPCEKIMIRGSNGRGKSTLLKLMMGIYRPVCGKIFYGEADTSEINIKSMSEKYCYISQDPNIVEDGINENIALNEDYDRQKCSAALDALNLSNVKNTETSRLSQGEKQRLNIGRALYKSYTHDGIMFVAGDEIFSNVDSKNRAEITRSFFEQFKAKAVVLVCHDNMDCDFDRIFTVENGGITISKGEARDENTSF